MSARRRDAAGDPPRRARLRASRPICPTASPSAAPDLRAAIRSSPPVCCPTARRSSAGARLVQGDYAEALTLIAQRRRDGAARRRRSATSCVECMEKPGGFVAREGPHRLPRGRARRRSAASYRGWEIVGPPPPAASGVHIIQMLNILEGYDIAAARLRHGRRAPSARRGAEDRLRRPRRRPAAIRLSSRCRSSASPSKAYADERRAGIDLARAQALDRRACARWKGRDTTHLTVADGMGNVVTTTQTINSLFGARFIVPGTGMVPNNYMSNFDPRPGNALSIAPGKRVTTSMSPMMALRDGRLVYALGLPGGRKIFPAAYAGADQPDRPRHGAAGGGRGAAGLDRRARCSRSSTAFRKRVRAGLRARGHTLQVMPTVAGGMNAIQFHDDGSMTGAACWRADGTPVALGGGLARRRRALRAAELIEVATAAAGVREGETQPAFHSPPPSYVVIRGRWPAGPEGESLSRKRLQISDHGLQDHSLGFPPPPRKTGHLPPGEG